MIAGCYRAFESRPYFQSDIGWQVKGGRFIVGPGIEITMKVSNSQLPFSHSSPTDYFGVSLYFDPARVGFTFRPDQTFLIFNGEKIRPSSVYAQFAGNNFRSVEWTCGEYPRGLGAGPIYAVSRGVCFDLYFYVKPPSPDDVFSMDIEGLVLDDRPVNVPELHFRKGSFQVFDFLGK